MLTRSLVLLVCQFRHFRISHFIGNFQCGRWDLNPHERNAHKILSLARLPVPTLPHDRISLGFFIFSLATSDSIAKWIFVCQHLFSKVLYFLFFLLFCHFYLWPCSFCFQEFFVCSYFGCRHFERTVGMDSILYFPFERKSAHFCHRFPHTTYKKESRLQRISCNRINRAYKQQSSKRQIRFKKNAFFFLLSTEKGISGILSYAKEGIRL